MAWEVPAKLSIRKGQPDWFEGSSHLLAVEKAIAKAARALFVAALKNATFKIHWDGRKWVVILNDETYSEFSLEAPLSAILLTSIDPDSCIEEQNPEVLLELVRTIAKFHAKIERIKTVDPE